jgi:AcrR family transcriptional regulator
MDTKATLSEVAGRSAPRDRILGQAILLFAKYGFDGMTMRRLGDAVGLDNSSIYRHFRSKAAVASAALDHVAGEVFAKVAPPMDPARPVSLQALEDLCAAVGLYFFDHQASARLMIHWIMSMGAEDDGFSVGVPATDISRPGGAMIMGLRAWLDAGVRAGTLRHHASPESLVILFGAILIRPATRGYLLATLEPERPPSAARQAWEQELRTAIRGAFAP